MHGSTNEQTVDHLTNLLCRFYGRRAPHTDKWAIVSDRGHSYGHVKKAKLAAFLAQGLLPADTPIHHWKEESSEGIPLGLYVQFWEADSHNHPGEICLSCLASAN